MILKVDPIVTTDTVSKLLDKSDWFILTVIVLFGIGYLYSIIKPKEYDKTDCENKLKEANDSKLKQKIMHENELKEYKASSDRKFKEFKEEYEKKLNAIMLKLEQKEQETLILMQNHHTFLGAYQVLQSKDPSLPNLINIK